MGWERTPISAWEFFYADDGMVSSRYSYWLQHSMEILISIFWRYGLADNVAKSRTMTCQPGTLRSGIPEEAREHNFMGVGASYHERLRKRIH